MSNHLLKGKKGIIFGALNEQSIAWKVAELCVAEGAQIVLTNAPVAAKIGQTEALSQKLNASLIFADVTKMEEPRKFDIRRHGSLGRYPGFCAPLRGNEFECSQKKPLHR